MKLAALASYRSDRSGWRLRTCLVVDGSPVTRGVARGILERMGFHVMEAETGEKALGMCRCVLPEAILLDWKMPVQDGYAFLGDLLALPGGYKPRVVFCTTEDELTQRAGAVTARAHEPVAQLLEDIVTAKFRAAGLLTFTVFPGSEPASLLNS
jgi:two-component system chemotaxis response regulator CheY